MKEFYGHVAPVCGRTGGKAVRLSEPKVGPRYKTRELGSLLGKENIITMWHKGYHVRGGKGRDDYETGVQAANAEDFDNQVTVSVKYLTDAERADYLITVDERGHLRRKGEEVHTLDAKRDQLGRAGQKWIFVMDEFGNIYGADPQKEMLARGLGDYYRACDENLYTAVTEGVALRKWTKAAPVDHYRTIFLDQEVPCALALPGGKVGSSAPAEEDPRWLRDLRRTPYSSDSTSVAVRVRARAVDPDAEPKPEPEGEPGQEKDRKKTTKKKKVEKGQQGSYITQEGGGGSLFSYDDENDESGSSSGSGSTSGSDEEDDSDDVVVDDEVVEEGDPEDDESGSRPLRDGLSSSSSSSSSVSVSSSSSSSSKSGGERDRQSVPSVQEPRRWKVKKREAWACLKTIKPGQGIYVITAPRTPEGALDLGRLQTLEDDWRKLQDQYAQEWNQREQARKDAHEQRQERRRKRHEELQKDLPESQRTQFQPAPFELVPFERQPFAPRPSESPQGEGWVCRNCFARRTHWPRISFLRLDEQKIKPVYDDVKQLDPAAFLLLRWLHERGHITQDQQQELMMYSVVKAPTKVELFHHSSFLAGRPVAAAGELQVADGRVDVITNTSGHYLPPATYLLQVGQELILKQAALVGARFQFSGDPDPNVVRLVKDGNGVAAGSTSVAEKINDIRTLKRKKQGENTFLLGQEDYLAELRRVLTQGLRLSPRPMGPVEFKPDQSIPCHGETEPGTRCKETSATTDFMDYVEGKGWLCQACLERSRQPVGQA